MISALLTTAGWPVRCCVALWHRLAIASKHLDVYTSETYFWLALIVMSTQIDSAPCGTGIGYLSLMCPSPVYSSLSRELLVKLVSFYPTREDSDVSRITHGLVSWLSRLTSIKNDVLDLLCASEEFRVYCCDVGIFSPAALYPHTSASLSR
ncbi:hypothetical protein JAAARDRAFT_439121 [Jaapia argillacea MUCL 33604]|uniref:Uncharacterized protein n=1 Tax=Jaapia argillacea MUCL 33604 TaxID=933084 RepID=A0A067PSF0_9AGAM|nr:hypothetical protein JAAARDRAFT_439121 [Jaapia argillacea MUCL 33604]